MQNAKNRLHNLLKELGYWENCVDFDSRTIQRADTNHTETEATLTLADGRKIRARGVATKRRDAEIAAAAEIIETIQRNHRDLLIDWPSVRIEAQAGDGLIKLCGYLSNQTSSAEEKSRWLQRMETDSHMVTLFNRLQADRHPTFTLFGTNLGNKRKATFIEAMIWRQFGPVILAEGATDAFDRIARFLEHPGKAGRYLEEV